MMSRAHARTEGQVLARTVFRDDDELLTGPRGGHVQRGRAPREGARCERKGRMSFSRARVAATYNVGGHLQGSDTRSVRERERSGERGQGGRAPAGLGYGAIA